MTITADFSGGEKTVTTEPLYQWDTGQKLALSGLPATSTDIQVHFANAAMAQAIVKATATENSLPTCDIPNEFLQYGSAAKARAWVYYKEGSSKGYTIKTVLIPITPRKRPNDYVSPEDPDSQGIVDRALELLEHYQSDLDGKVNLKPIPEGGYDDCTESNTLYYGYAGGYYVYVLPVVVTGSSNQSQYKLRADNGLIECRTRHYSNGAWGSWDNWTPVGREGNIADGAITENKLAAALKAVINAKAIVDTTTQTVEYNANNPRIIYTRARVNSKNAIVLTTSDNYYQLAFCYDGSEYTRQLTGSGSTTYNPWLEVQNKVIAEEVGDLKSALDDVYDNNGVPAQNLTISDFTSQDCYKTNGESQVFGVDWVSTDFIPCYGSTVKYKGYASWSSSVDLAVVAFFGVDKQMTHYIASSEVLSAIGNGTVSGEVSTQPGDYYVRVISYTSRVPDSYVVVSAGNLYSKLSVVDDLSDAVGTSGIEIGYNGFTSDQILRENGTFQSHGEPWRSTDYISCFGAKSVQYTATPFHGNGVNLVAYVAFFDRDKNLISFLDSSSFPFGYHVNQTGSADVPQNAYYVRIVGQDSKCRLSIESTGLEQFTAFKASDLKILCIGDSLTRGVINTDGDIIRESYPYWVGKTLSSYAANAGYPGGMPRTWWARRANYEQPTADTDLVLIMFGTNGELTQNTLATDVEPYTDYADYADTSVGCYCKIIEWIMEQTSNHAQIILMTPPMPWPTTRDESYARGKYNTCLSSLPVIRAIAERYALPVIDVFYGSGMNKYNGSVFRPNDGIHFGAKGYHKLGTFIARQVASMYSTFDVDETGTVIS